MRKKNEKKFFDSKLFVVATIVTAVFIIHISLLHIGYNIYMLIIHKEDFILLFLALIGDIIFFIFSIIMMLFFIRYPCEDFNKFIRGMETISNGDFSIRLKENSNSPNNDFIITFNKMAQSLASLDQMKDNFISDFSHDLKTPLASILGFTKLLSSKNISEEEKREYIDIIIKECNKLSKLAKNLLLLNKINSQNEILEVHPFLLDEQLRNCIILFENGLNEKNIDISLNSESIKYIGNETLIREIWINILSNAIKYNKENGSIAITAEKTNDSIKVTIADTGIGMDKETQNNAFTRYYIGKSNKSYDATGIGLAIVKKIMNITKGQVFIDSELGKGTKFTIILPCISTSNLVN